MFEWHKKEAPVFTGIARGVGGFGFGKSAAAAAVTSAVTSSLPVVTDKWGFEGNSVVSTGTRGAAITRTGASFSATAKTGTVALAFDGSNDYATFTGGSSTTNVSFALWIYWRGHNPSGRSYLADFRAGNGNNGYWIIDSNNTMTIITNGSGPENTFSFTPVDNTWEHYAFVASDAGTAKIYRNGSLYHSVSSTGTNVDGNIVLGTYFGVLGGSGQYFTNAIYDNLVYHRGTLTSADITALYTSTSTFA